MDVRKPLYHRYRYVCMYVFRRSSDGSSCPPPLPRHVPGPHGRSPSLWTRQGGLTPTPTPTPTPEPVPEPGGNQTFPSWPPNHSPSVRQRDNSSSQNNNNSNKIQNQNQDVVTTTTTTTLTATLTLVLVLKASSRGNANKPSPGKSS